MLAPIVVCCVIAIPLLVACFAVYTRKDDAWPKNPDDFFTAEGNLKTAGFLDTSVAYAYQVAAISLFTYWGYNYGFWTIWVPLCWGVGYFLLELCVKKGFVTKFLESSNGETIHRLLDNYYGGENRTSGIKWIAIFAGLCSVFGLAGTAFFEAEYTAETLSRVMNLDKGPTQSLYLLLFLFFIAFALLYIVTGGQKAVVKTDGWQLKIAYVVFMAFWGGILGIAFAAGHVWVSGGLFVASILLSLVLLLRLKKVIKNEKTTRVILVLGIVCLTISAIVSFSGTKGDAFKLNDSIQKAFFAPTSKESFFGIGFFALVSLLISNASWQFVDITNWQRMSSIRKETNFKAELEEALKFMKIYSPITWVFAIFAGMGIRLIFDAENSVNPLSDLLASFMDISNGNIQHIVQCSLAILMLLALVFIMFSTLDSLILGISFTAAKDIYGSGKKESALTLRKSRVITMVTTIILLVLYILLRHYASAPDDILYTVYSFQIGLLPSVIFALFGVEKFKKRSTALCSILLGITAPIFVLRCGLSPLEWAPLATILASFIGAFIPFLFVKAARS